MNPEIQKMIAQALMANGGGGELTPEQLAIVARMLPQDPTGRGMVPPNAYKGGFPATPVGGPNLDDDREYDRGVYQPSPGVVGYGAMPQDPATSRSIPDTSRTNGMMGWSEEPVGGMNVNSLPSHMRGVDPRSPGMMQPTPQAPAPMANPNPMAQPDYRAPSRGAPEPLDPQLMQDALRGSYDDASRFDDARAVQTADMGGLTVSPAGGYGTTATNRIESDEVASRNSLSRLDGIVAMIEENPDLIDMATTTRGDIKTRVLSLKDRFGFELSPEQESYLGDSAAFRQTVLMNVNDYIKEITGAQVGQGDETQRLMGALPNVGDSPTEFRAKLANAINLTRLQVARQNYMRSTGTEERPSDSELTRILRDRGAELYREALGAGVPPAEARLRAANALSREFGL